MWTAPLTVDQVIERNTQAMGGRAAIEAVKSIEVDLHIVDADVEVDGRYRAARPGRMRIDVLAGGKHVFTEAFDGDRGWQWKGAAVEEASPKATRHCGTVWNCRENCLVCMSYVNAVIALIWRSARQSMGRITIALRITLSDGYINDSLH